MNDTTKPAAAWLPEPSARDWTEDAAHENGNYSCGCSTCGQRFYGHKRRVTCKVCAAPAAPEMPEEKPTGQVYGIIDPDYGRIYTMVRKLAWEEGYAIGLHGSFTRDLDMIAVPWDDGRRCKPEKLIARILQSTGLREAHGNPGEKPHGRKVWTLLFSEFGDPRFIDLSIMPAVVVAAAPQAEEAEPEPQVPYTGSQTTVSVTRYRLAEEAPAMHAANCATQLESSMRGPCDCYATPERIQPCWCSTCRPVTLDDCRMVLCPTCGNKRCPHANDHRNACTGSNEPGQPGSSYPASLPAQPSIENDEKWRAGFEAGRRYAHKQACQVTHALMRERDEWKAKAIAAEAQLSEINKWLDESDIPSVITNNERSTLSRIELLIRLKHSPE